MRTLWFAVFLLWLLLGCKLGIHVNGGEWLEGNCACVDRAAYKAKEAEKGTGSFQTITPDWERP